MAVFRVEISSEQNLSDAVKQAIAQAAPGCDLSRVGRIFSSSDSSTTRLSRIRRLPRFAPPILNYR